MRRKLRYHFLFLLGKNLFPKVDCPPRPLPEPREDEQVVHTTPSGGVAMSFFFCFDIVKSLQRLLLHGKWLELVSSGVTGYI